MFREREAAKEAANNHNMLSLEVATMNLVDLKQQLANVVQRKVNDAWDNDLEGT